MSSPALTDMSTAAAAAADASSSTSTSNQSTSSPADTNQSAPASSAAPVAGTEAVPAQNGSAAPAETEQPKQQKLLLLPSTKAVIKEKIEASLDIITFHVQTVVLRSVQFREEIVRYLYKVANNKYTPAVFELSFYNNMWAPEITQIPIDSERAREFYRESSQSAANLAKANSVMLSINFVHPQCNLFTMRMQTVLTLTGKVPKNVTARSKTEQIDLEVRHKYLAQMMVTHNIISMGEFEDGDDFCQSALNAAINRREQTATEAARHSITQSVFETSIALVAANAKRDPKKKIDLATAEPHDPLVVYDALRAISKDDADAAKAGTAQPPLRVFRVYCGDVQRGVESCRVMNKADLEAMVESIKTNKLAGSNDDDGGTMLQAVESILATYDKQREPGWTTTLIVHMHGGVLCGMSTVSRVDVNVDSLLSTAAEELKRREEQQKQMEEAIRAAEKSKPKAK